MMKKSIIIISAIASIVFFLFINTSPSRKEIIQQKTVKKHFTPQESKAAYLKAKIKRKAAGIKNDKPEEFAKYHRLIRTKQGEAGPNYKMNYKIAAYQKAKAQQSFLKSTQINLNWIERGPANISGRTRSIIVDTDDPTSNTWIAGAVSGGVWKTDDAGESWTNLTPNLPNLAVVTLATSAANSSVIYAGTGEAVGSIGGIIGDGIFKSYNKGDTWEQLSATASNKNFKYVNRIIADPIDENSLLAVTGTALYKSNDGGITFTEKFNDDNFPITHIIADPTDFNVLYAAVTRKGIIKSEDRGETWNYVFNNTVGRIELAISPSNTDVVYGLNENSELFVTKDAGANWLPTQVTEGTQVPFLGTQGWYDNTLAVSLDNPDQLYIGGIDIFKVTVTDDSKIPTLDVTTENTSSFLSFIDFGETYLGGGAKVNSGIDSYTSIELRFGNDMVQKAHRFVVPEGRTSGVPITDYTYQDYVEVPFEVWDVENNRQLTVSFRDQDRNGVFNLTLLDDANSRGREYLYINDLAYSDTASDSIISDGGPEFHEIAYFWPVLADSAVWEPLNLPESKIIISKNEIDAKNLTSAYFTSAYTDDAPRIHADQHSITFVKTSDNITRMIITNDGGITYTDDLGKNWISTNNGYNTTQFYGVDKHPTQDRYIGGMQDNGTHLSPVNSTDTSSWSYFSSGDGFDAVWHATQPNKIIGSVYENMLIRTEDGGNTFTYITQDIQDYGSGNAPFLTQIGYSPLAPDKLFIIGKSGVTRSLDFGTTWELISIPEATWGWDGYGNVEPSLINPEIIWAGNSMDLSGKLHVSTDAGNTFTACNNYTKTLGRMTGLATHPTEPNTAYTLFSFSGYLKILRTTDLGETWEDITKFENGVSTNGFPNVAVYTLIVMPHNPNEIWVGTEIGLVISTNNGISWHLADNGLPAVAIWEMKIRGKQIIVATHGRGIWTTDIEAIASVTKASLLIGAAISPSGNININYSHQSQYDSIQILIDQNQAFTLPANTSIEQNIYQEFNNYLDTGKHKLQMVSYRDNIAYSSGSIFLYSFDINSPSTTYINTFDVQSDDFTGEGFSQKEFAGLGTGYAIHSSHPYEEQKDIYYTLKTPIIISNNASQNKPYFSYNDIPLVEPGEDGAVTGSPDFYDYVVVEGSTNGMDWEPIADGYDYTSVKDLAEANGKDINSDPVASMFLEHEINLLNTFNENDTILLRFKLHSDPYTAGWGWVIDNINIQGMSTSNETLGLNNNQIYPNPCDQQLSIKWDTDPSSKNKINVYNINGKKQNFKLNHSSDETHINTSQLKSGLYILTFEDQRIKFQVQH